MAYQNRTWESIIRLIKSDYSGEPAEGVTYDEISVLYRKTGDSAFQSKEVVSTDWVDLENGFYALKWASEELSMIGPFVFQIYGTTFDAFNDKFDVDYLPIGAGALPPMCVVFGNIRDLGGNPAVTKLVVFRPVRMPTQYGDSLVSADVIRAVVDAVGNFSAPLARGVKAMVTAEQAGINNQITIPDQDSVPLLDLLPPINS